MFFGILIFDPNRQFWKMVDFAQNYYNVVVLSIPWVFFALAIWNNYLPLNRNLSMVSFVSLTWYHVLFAQFLKLRKSSYINIKRTIFYSVVEYGFLLLQQRII